MSIAERDLLIAVAKVQLAERGYIDLDLIADLDQAGVDLRSLV